LGSLFVGENGATGLFRLAEHVSRLWRESEDLERAGGEPRNVQRDFAERQLPRLNAEGLPVWLAARRLRGHTIPETPDIAHAASSTC
jgi:hypothetical protein